MPDPLCAGGIAQKFEVKPDALARVVRLNALAAEGTPTTHGSVDVYRCTGDCGATRIDDGSGDGNRIAVAVHRQVEARRNWIGGERTKGSLRNQRGRISWGHLHHERGIEVNRGREIKLPGRWDRSSLRKRSESDRVRESLRLELALPGDLNNERDRWA